MKILTYAYIIIQISNFHKISYWLLPKLIFRTLSPGYKNVHV